MFALLQRDYFFFSIIRTKDQRFVAERGRVSMISTTSPSLDSLFSSCALSFLVVVMILLYIRWRLRFSTTTVIVLSILEEKTIPCLTLREFLSIIVLLPA